MTSSMMVSLTLMTLIELLPLIPTLRRILTTHPPIVRPTSPQMKMRSSPVQCVHQQLLRQLFYILWMQEELRIARILSYHSIVCIQYNYQLVTIPMRLSSFLSPSQHQLDPSDQLKYMSIPAYNSCWLMTPLPKASKIMKMTFVC